jgi:hypothetical protein
MRIRERRIRQIRIEILLCSILTAAFAAAQHASQIPTPIPPDKQIITAKVVEYNRSVMSGTYEGDLIVRADGSGEFFHLIYSPYDFGFESPSADASQLLPRIMTSDSSLLWTFTVHAPRGFREQGPCKTARSGASEKQENALPRDPGVFVPLPGAGNVVPPPVATLPCLVIERWSGGPAQPDAAHPVRAAL